MTERDIFCNVCALDHRYSISESTVFEGISGTLSENAAILSCAKAEVALIKAHLFCQNRLTNEIATKLDKVATTVKAQDVYKEEEKTQHNIRALVNVMKTLVPKEFAPLVHLGATSVDILDTATSLRIKEAIEKVVLPELKGLEIQLCNLAKQNAFTPQVGRTHGQHAVPITFGWTLAEFVSRLGKSILAIKQNTKNLKGKLSGPVGCYNGTSMIVKDPELLEKKYLEFLGLEPSEYSNQLVEPEYLLRLLLELNTAFGIIANLADDLRNLQRSEIGEVFEEFSSTQVGSSTMPQKRNPWNSEHVKSLWKAFAPRVITFYMDQISEHQRDLTNSASQRFIADYICGFAMAVTRMHKVLKGLKADTASMKKNLLGSGDKVQGGVLAEPAYILLGQAGVSNGHEIIRKITLQAEKQNKSFYEVLKQDTKHFSLIKEQLKALGTQDTDTFFSDPALYKGLATTKSIRLADKYLALMQTL